MIRSTGSGLRLDQPIREVEPIAQESSTRDVAHRYVDAWTHGDRDGVRELVSPDASVEWNIGLPADVATLLETLTQLARVAETVQIVAETYADERAAVIY